LLTEALTSGDVLAQIGVIVFVAIISIPLAMALWGLAVRFFHSAKFEVGQVEERAESRWHHEAMDALRAVPLWKDLPEAHLLEIARRMRTQNFKPGSTVLRQGESEKGFYLISRGAFEVIVDGREIKRLGRGDYFGSTALISDAPRTASVVAVEPSRAFVLDRANYDAMLAHDLETKQRLEAAMAYRVQVAQNPLFRDLAPADLDLLLSRLVPVSVQPREDIIREGEHGDRFYLVRSGKVEIVQDGKVIATRAAGEAFGEIALLMNIPRTATVRAAEPTELLTLSADDFEMLVRRYLGRGEQVERLAHLRLEGHKPLIGSFATAGAE
jgi:CRP-like cAMP-binding protein